MESENIDDNELCVMCGARSNYSKTEPTSHRYGYVENVGQFCFRCAYFGGEWGKDQELHG